MKLILLFSLLASTSIIAQDKMSEELADFVLKMHKDDSMKYIINTPSVCKLLNEAILVKNETAENKKDFYACQREESKPVKNINGQLKNISEFEGMIQTKTNEIDMWTNKIIFKDLK